VGLRLRGSRRAMPPSGAANVVGPCAELRLRDAMVGAASSANVCGSRAKLRLRFCGSRTYSEQHGRRSAVVAEQ